MRKLTEKQRRFVHEYLISFNATDAAVKAGYSKKTAEQQGYQILQIPLVRDVIDKHRLKTEKKFDISRERILNELSKVAFSNMSDFATWNQSGVDFIPSEQVDPDKIAAVSEVIVHTNQHGGAQKIKLHDKLKALELLGKHTKLFGDEDTNSTFDPIVIQMPLYNKQVVIQDSKEVKELDVQTSETPTA